MCLSAFSWGAYAVLSMPVLRRLNPLVVGGWTMLLGGGAVLPLTLSGFPGLSEPLASVDWVAVGIGSWAAALYSTLLCSSFAIAAWQVNVSRLGANRVLIYLYLVTLVGLLARSWCWGRTLGWPRSRERRPSCSASIWPAAPHPTEDIGSERPG